jgi:hypothetical protein
MFFVLDFTVHYLLHVSAPIGGNFREVVKEHIKDYIQNSNKRGTMRNNSIHHLRSILLRFILLSFLS